MELFSAFNGTNFLKFDILSKYFCLAIFEQMNILGFELSYWIASRDTDTEMTLRILLSPFYLFFKFFLSFSELIDLQVPVSFFQVLQI